MGTKKAIFRMVMMLGLVFAPALLQAEESLPVIKGIRVFRSGDDIGLEISADKSFAYSCSKMPALLRVVIDLPRTELGKPDTAYRYKSVLISNIEVQRKNINDVTITRLSVNLTEDANYEIRTDPSDSTRLTLVLRKAAQASNVGTAEAKPGKDAKVEVSSPQPAAPAAPPAKDAPSPVEPAADQPVTVTGVSCGANSIEIQSSGNIGEFKAFTLQKPGRLVIDISGARSTLRTISIPANKLGVLKARIGLYEGKLRMAFDAGMKPFPAYDIVKTGTGLRIVLTTKVSP